MMRGRKYLEGFSQDSVMSGFVVVLLFLYFSERDREFDIFEQRRSLM